MRLLPAIIIGALLSKLNATENLETVEFWSVTMPEPLSQGEMKEIPQIPWSEVGKLDFSSDFKNVANGVKSEFDGLTYNGSEDVELWQFEVSVPSLNDLKSDADKLKSHLSGMKSFYDKITQDLTRDEYETEEASNSHDEEFWGLSNLSKDLKSIATEYQSENTINISKVRSAAEKIASGATEIEHFASSEAHHVTQHQIQI